MKIYKGIWSGRNYAQKGIWKFPPNEPVYHRSLLKYAVDSLTKRQCQICGGNIVRGHCDFCGEEAVEPKT